jgi:hypothetical protein
MERYSIFEITKDLFDRLMEDPIGKVALRRYNWTIQFIILDQQEPFYVEIKDGQPSFHTGTILEKMSWSERTVVEADSETYKAICNGSLKPSDALIAGRLSVSGLLSRRTQGCWTTCLLRLGQVSNYNEYLHSGYVKRWLR